MKRLIVKDAGIVLLVVGILIGIISIALASLFQDNYGIADWRSRSTGFIDMIAIVVLLLARPAKKDDIQRKANKLLFWPWTRMLKYLYVAGLSFMLFTKMHMTMVLLLSR